MRYTLLFAFLLFVSASLNTQTILAPGDLAVLGVNANLNGCGGDSGEDEVSFVCFKPIETGTEIQITDNGWQRRLPGRWGNAEGFITARRTGGAIPAGTTITFRLRSIAGQNDSGYRAILPDDGWTFTNEAFNTLNFNSGGDQIFFLQGGVWDQGTVNSGFDFQHDATYTGGTILFAFNSKTAWVDFANDSKDSGLPDALIPCYNMAPTGGTTNFISYAAPVAPTDSVTQLEWIARIANPDNWTSYGDCSSFISPPERISIQPSGMSIDCAQCRGCGTLTDTLTFRLPFGGPYRVTYTDGRDTFAINNITDGWTQTVSVDTTTAYDLLTVEDVNGCPIYSNFENGALLEVFEPVTATLDSTLCLGEFLILNGVRYDENNRTGQETLTASNGCDSIVSINLTFLPGLSGQLLGDTTICRGETATLTFELSGAELFDVVYTDDINMPVQLNDIRSGYSIEVAPTTTMTYRIVSITAEGVACAASGRADATINIDEFAVALDPSQYGSYNLSCAEASDGSLQANPNGGAPPYDYLWETGDTTDVLSGLTAGGYSLTVSDALGCTAEVMASLVAPAPLNFEAAGITPGCNEQDGGAIRLRNIQGGEPPYEVSIDEQFFQAIPALPFQINDLTPGTYDITLQDVNDCRIQAPVTIPAPPLLTLDLGPDQILKLGDSLLLSPQLNFSPESIEWSPRQFLLNPEALSTHAKPTRSLTYRLTATDVAGCTVSDEVFVEVDDSRSAYAPTAFSPDGDDLNGRFTIYGGSDLRAIKTLQVFDRWGSLVYQAENLLPNDTRAGWDGTFQGQELPTSVFVFSAVLVFADGVEVPFSGDVLLVR